ncbi:class I SAM-dependent methyltransferase [Halanaeroarchaeum sulfurireducens]|uniref:Menaquinone biosynthesis methyltransferase UbiE n=1 Tax=Halanaeroarchaeum sulfurireducens TaxID=1604004 RepID=A0A0F7PE08_9EURY|nr:class I SAM-dependent methyltransferase [Halanaeroarchaeum sulfurireducens]AKH97573.1 menaquinone biosynthesis methyltransferase UbiE [Halanaeroarchaeum sulfurireducens]ALG81969.1 menaquinone biosynthesis methyltransferase UbiE [Halanaeroarchaeum sulfurireducens]
MHDVPVFDRVAPIYDALLPGTAREPLDDGLSYAERDLSTLVDLGGGTGRAARALAHEPIVFDGSQGMLRKARNQGMAAIRGDVRHLPFPDASLDAVISVDAVHHFPAVPTVVEDVFRTLAVGGVFVVREFDPDTLRGTALVAGERLVGFASTFYTVDELDGVLDAAGFDTIVEERGFVYTLVGVKPDPK